MYRALKNTQLEITETLMKFADEIGKAVEPRAEQATGTSTLEKVIEKQDNQFKVLSYNVLADSLTQIKSTKKICQHRDIRFPLLRAEIIQAEADIICLQECDHYDDFYKPMLEESGYQINQVVKK